MNAPQSLPNIRNDIEELLHNWIKWLSTRRFYTKTLSPNILAMLQVDRRPSRGEPDGRNDPLCAAFNLIISEAQDSERLPFLYVYLKAHRPRPIKALAFDLGIDSDTVYQRAHHAAPKYLSQAYKLQELHAKMQKEIEDYID